MEDATLVQPASSHLVLRSLKNQTAFPLAGEMLVGREVECDIPLKSGHISRYHSKISVSPNGIFIEDLKSTNGTFVNGQRINARTRIGLGDEIRFHDIPFRIVSDESGDEDATLIGEIPEPSLSADAIAAEEFSESDTNPHIRAANVTLEAPATEPQPVKPKEAVPVPDQQPEESADSTQLLSATHLDRLVSRSKQAQKDVKAGSGARLVVMTAPLRGKVYALEEASVGTQWQIGRDEGSDIQINDKTISGNHARLSKVANGYLLAATEAKNGVLINGKSETRYFLSHGDKIQMGRIELIFKNDKALPEVPVNEDAMLNEQIKNTRRLVIGALITLAVLVAAFVANTT